MAFTKRQEAKSATRAKVLEAARRLFECFGYEQTTMRRIADDAGMSTGAVFANFTGKDALYREIYGHAPISPEAGAELRGALKALRDVVKEHPALQGREFVGLGIQVNNALAKAA